MLTKLLHALENQEIKFYWCQDSNLLEKLSINEMQNMAFRLKKIVNTIETTIDSDPLAIARFLCKYYIYWKIKSFFEFLKFIITGN